MKNAFFDTPYLTLTRATLDFDSLYLLHSHKILTIQYGKPCYLTQVLNSLSLYTMVLPDWPFINLGADTYTHWYILGPNSLS